MMCMRKVSEAIAILCLSIALVSCDCNQNKMDEGVKKSKIECPILYMLDRDTYLDLRKPGRDAVKDASNQIRKGRRQFILVSSDLEGYAALHDYKYSELWGDIQNNEQKYKKYNIEFGGIGSPEGVYYTIYGQDMAKCRDQMENLRPYSQEYNDYILQNLTEMLEKSAR